MMQEDSPLYSKLKSPDSRGVQTEISAQSKHSKTSKTPSIRKRAAYIYHQISNNDRGELLRRVLIGKETMAQVSRDLNINYSTAKTIIRRYRRFNRVEKVPHTMRKARKTAVAYKEPAKEETQKREAKEEEQQQQVKQEAYFSSSSLPLQISTQRPVFGAAHSSLQLRKAFSLMSNQLAILEAQNERRLLLVQQERLRLLAAIQSTNSQNFFFMNRYPVANRLLSNQYLYSQQHHLQNVFDYVRGGNQRITS